MVVLTQAQLLRYQTERDRITALIAKLDLCLEAFILNPSQSYTLTTGQTVQQVTRVNVPALKDWRRELWNDLADIEALLDPERARSAYFTPGF